MLKLSNMLWTLLVAPNCPASRSIQELLCVYYHSTGDQVIGLGPLPCIVFLMSLCPVDGYFTRERHSRLLPPPTPAQASLMVTGGPWDM